MQKIQVLTQTARLLYALQGKEAEKEHDLLIED